MKNSGGKLLPFLLLVLLIVPVRAQDLTEKHRVKYQHLKLSTVLDSLAIIYRVNFSYNARLPELNRIVSVDQEGTLYEILQNLIGSSSIGFDMLGRQVVIFPIVSLPPAKSVFATVDSFFSVRGKVYNTQREPLSYASVSLRGKSIATVTNADGVFLLKIPNSYRSDTLVVTYLGYRPLMIRLDTLSKDELMLVLHESPLELPPVLVRNVSATSIVEQAIRNIFSNYFQQNAMYSAFYRETVQDEDDYLSIIEALVDIAKAPYSSWMLNDQAKIFKGYRSQATKRLQAFSFKLEGGIYNAIKIDIIRELPLFLSTDGIPGYTYRIEGKVAYNDRTLYVIRFGPTQRLAELSYEGTIYIDDKTYAVAGAIFSLTPQGVNYAQHLLVKKVPRKTQIKLQEANYMVFYRLMNNRWFLEYTAIELKLKAKSRSFLYNSTITTRSEMVVTRIDTTNHSRFRWNEIVRSNDILANIINAYHDDYWEHFNVIIPEEPLIEAINKLSQSQDNDNSKTTSLWKIIFPKK